MKVGFITWSSIKGTLITQDTTCNGDNHIFNAPSSQYYDGLLCDCRKTKWIYKKCDHCGHTNGEAISA